MQKKALIIGVSGQVGSLMAQFLIKKNYLVYGISRKKNNSNCTNLKKLGINKIVKVINIDVENYKKIKSFFNSFKPDEVYQFSGVSSVSRAKNKPLKTLKYIFNITYNLLQICKKNKNIKIYFSGTGQIFNNRVKNISEDSEKFPENIYSYSKYLSLNLVERYRELYGLKVCTGITYNHESYLRSKEFVTMKIIKDALDVKNGKKKRVILNNIDSFCDWGWAPEYIEIMWMMLQKKKFKDYIVATGRTYSVYDFVKIIFDYLKLSLKTNLKVLNKKKSFNKKFFISTKKINRDFNWKAKIFMKDIAILMLKNQYEKNN
jgi:GDPmannose 4,6-dehydratase